MTSPLHTAAWEARAADLEAQSTTALATLATVLDPFDVSTLTVADHLFGPTWTLTVVTDDHLHLAARLWDDGNYEVTLVEPSGNDWTKVSEVTSLSALGITLGPPSYPEWIAPTGAHDAHNEGDRVTHDDKTWESLSDANVWEPGVSSEWREVTP